VDPKHPWALERKEGGENPAEGKKKKKEETWGVKTNTGEQSQQKGVYADEVGGVMGFTRGL